MINKEETYVRDKLYMQRHPLLQPKMRTILLDWLMEVSFFHAREHFKGAFVEVC